MADTPTRDFDLGDVLSITTGRLVSRRHMNGVYDILNFMTGDNLFTHALPRAMRSCEPALLRQHPQLAHLEVPELTPETYLPWLTEQEAKFGARLPVAPLSGSDKDGYVPVRIDPVLEAQAIFGKEQVVTVEVPDGR